MKHYEFDRVVAMWEKAMGSDDFKKEPKVESPEVDYGFDSEECNISDNGMITENDEPKPIKPNMSDKEIGDVVKSKANAANPISPSSVGKDQDYKPSLVNTQQLEQLHDMKVNLHELEGKLNAENALAKTKEGQKVQKQIDEMKKKIDELSDSLTPNFLQSYLS